MLSDEDKKDVIANKANFTCEQIEKELAAIGFRKGVNFSLQNSTFEQPQAQTGNGLEGQITFALANGKGNSLPDWVQQVKAKEAQI